jgi:hypothetical protein
MPRAGYASPGRILLGAVVASSAAAGGVMLAEVAHRAGRSDVLVSCLSIGFLFLGLGLGLALTRRRRAV